MKPIIPQDYIGKRYGKLTVISLHDKIPHKNRKCLCKCDCGNIKSIFCFCLSSGKTKSCGCYKTNPPTQIGSRYGRLIVLTNPVNVPYKNRKCLCLCDCGIKKEILLHALRRGNTKSCGCLSKEAKPPLLRPGQWKTLHGHATLAHNHSTTEYTSWRGMKRRCRGAEASTWKHYASKGIKVCERWQKFENFLADMGLKPSPKHTIERKDSNGDYSPDNCMWALQTIQQRNRSNNHRLTFNGETHCIAEWAERINMDRRILQQRIWSGWDVQRALTQPIRTIRKKKQP